MTEPGATGKRDFSLEEKLARKKELEKEQFQMMKDLYGHYRNGTFLSMDIVGSTKLKEGEDSICVVQSFQAFHRYINENISRGNWHKLSCIYDSFEIDNHFNRIIKYVANFLLQSTQRYDNRNLLSEIIFMEGVTG